MVNCEGNFNTCTEVGFSHCDYVELDSVKELRPTNNDLSIMQLNIQGLLNKQD